MLFALFKKKILILFLTIPLFYLNSKISKVIYAMESNIILLNFENIENSGSWMIVDDRVLGGVSQSNIFLHDEGYLIFLGEVSSDYGGGFASIRTTYENWGIGKYKGIVLRVKGDGKNYQFRCRLGNASNQIAYRHHFYAKVGAWNEIKLPFKEFLPTYRGRVLNNYPILDPNNIRQFGLMISDKQTGTFNLAVDWIGVY